MSDLSHVNRAGEASMVDVSAKTATARAARAGGHIRMSAAALHAIRDNAVAKGDVLAVARIAGIQGAKKCADLLPLAHVIGVHGAAVDLTIEDTGVRVAATIRTADRTGVEMEALTAVSIAALAVVDMVKGLDKSVSIGDIRLISKTGGKSGDWLRPAE